MGDKLRLPRFISSGMVLQRDIKINIWGWARADANVEIDFNDKHYIAVASHNGKWSLQLEESKAGGPYSMIITSDEDRISLEDILIGDVWLCSGQSNMDLPISRIKDFTPEVINAENKEIHCFKVDVRSGFFDTFEDYDSGVWKAVSAETIMDFSATAYFFAESLYNKYQVPIGLITCSLGGSLVETWMSEEALKHFPKQLEIMRRFQDEAYVEKVLAENEMNERDWYDRLNRLDNGHIEYCSFDYQASHWDTLQMPGNFEQQGLKDFSGVLWMRKEVNVPSCMAGKPAKLWLGTITDSDDTYINGEHIGATAYRYPPRKYDIPKGLLHEGKNIITLRVVSNNGQGCFTPDKKYALFNDEICINLEGEWKYTIGAVIDKKTETNWVNWKPTALYNGMLSPIIGYGIKGAIWYQGESNTDFPEEYEALFKTMIKSWRENWKQGNFPFLYVQLPNFMISSEQPQQSKWAELRQAQLNTLSLPNTGMIVGIDIGEWNDLHPLNKKEIGSRLGLLAREKVYGDPIHGSSPIVKNGIKQGNKIILTFNTVGGGLVIKGGAQLKHFAIADADNKYVWANANIEDDKVIVWNEHINNPVSVRYAWADNPDTANLYTKEGLPVAPFQLEV